MEYELQERLDLRTVGLAESQGEEFDCHMRVQSVRLNALGFGVLGLGFWTDQHRHLCLDSHAFEQP